MPDKVCGEYSNCISLLRALAADSFLISYANNNCISLLRALTAGAFLDENTPEHHLPLLRRVLLLEGGEWDIKWNEPAGISEPLKKCPIRYVVNTVTAFLCCER